MNSDNDEARRYVEQCYRTRTTLVNPIVDWTDDDVWEYLNEVVCVPHCCLYDEGFNRLGCIGCPMSGANKQKTEFKRWPKYYDAYLRAIARALQKKPKKDFPDAQSMMDWWLAEAKEKPIDGQIQMEFGGDLA